MDSFHAVITWSGFGVWFASAAAVGTCLRRLDAWSQRRPAAQTPQPEERGVPEAA